MITMTSSCRSFCRVLMTPFTGKSGKDQQGMSLIEIILVIALMGTLMTVLITNLIDTSDRGMIDIATVGMQKLDQKLTAYRLDNHKYPTGDQGLKALIANPSSSRKWRGPYADEKELQDPWGNPYGFESDGRVYKIICAGPDGQINTEDDITHPDDKEGGGEGGEES